MTDHDPLCPFVMRAFLDASMCPDCPVIARVRADERAKIAPVIEAARAWVERIVDPPNLWADEEDFALIKSVEALG